MICVVILYVIVKKITFTPKQFQFQGGLIKRKLKSTFKGTETAWNKFPKPAISAATPFIGMALSAKSENSKVGQATTKILKR